MMLTHLKLINCNLYISKFGYHLYDLRVSLCLRYSSPVYLTAEKVYQKDCVHTFYIFSLLLNTQDFYILNTEINVDHINDYQISDVS